MPPTPKDIDDCLRVLEALAEDRAELLNVEVDKRHRFVDGGGSSLSAAGAGSFQAAASVLLETEQPELDLARACYVCKTRVTRVHAFHDLMNSVDTGWVTDEDPHHIAQRRSAAFTRRSRSSSARRASRTRFSTV